MKIGIAGDFHAGIGKDDKDLRTVVATGIRRSSEYLADQELGKLIFNGDVTDHLANELSREEVDKGLCLEMCKPLVRLIQDRRGAIETVMLAGNTDWVLAGISSELKRVFFDYTGISRADVHIPKGGLEYVIPTPSGIVDITHGHTQKPEVWGHKGKMETLDQVDLMQLLQEPTADFLAQINAISGSHREDFLKAQSIGKNIQKIPLQFVRRLLSGIAGSMKMTPMYEPQFADMLHVRSIQKQMNVTGVMGHTHVAGARTYNDIQILNHGTSGAKPNPLERANDPKAHVVIVDAAREQYQLICTFDAANPSKKASVVQEGNLFAK